MLAVEDLDRYRSSQSSPLPNPPRWVEDHLEACLIVKSKGGETKKKKLKNFAWEKIPFIKKQIAREYGNVSFEIQVESFDESRWKLSCSPPKQSGRLWKRWAGEVWLVG